MAKTLMVQGTMSDAGKSLITAGLCRAFVNRGLKVAPFKPQNMALNSAVSIDGGEIGRAQALQANASRIPAHTDMNPVLIKPSSDTQAQLIVLGQAAGTIEATSYQQDKSKLLNIVIAAHQRLAQQYDLIIVEGAGSPAEVNLRKNDIANMGFAEAINCPVILLGDIDRGGVFAQLLGTLDLLSASEQKRIIGLLINKFRGDISLLDSGLDWLATRSNKTVLGVVPYLKALFLDQEDALDITDITDKPELKVIVPALPRISNHTDFDVLRLHPKVAFSFIAPGADIPAADLIILPGSKNVRADLHWLKQQGWDQVINKHLRYGGKLLGICGGFQMLGQQINDPQGIEDAAGISQGLGLLPMHTELMNDKKLRNVEAQLMLAEVTASGYEIHQGISTGDALTKPFCHIDGQADGAISDDNQIAGTYLHGLFDAPAAQAALLHWAGLTSTSVVDKSELREQGLERTAKTLESCIDISSLLDKVLNFDSEQGNAVDKH